MPAEVRAFTVTVPAGTTQAAPATFPLAVPVRTLRSVQVIVPGGCVGLVGFQIASGGVQIIPANQGGWIIANDEQIKWATDNYPTSGAFQAIAYNGDAFPHNLYFRLELDPPPGTGATPTSTLLSTGDISPAVVTAG